MWPSRARHHFSTSVPRGGAPVASPPLSWVRRQISYKDPPSFSGGGSPRSTARMVASTSPDSAVGIRVRPPSFRSHSRAICSAKTCEFRVSTGSELFRSIPGVQFSLSFIPEESPWTPSQTRSPCAIRLAASLRSGPDSVSHSDYVTVALGRPARSAEARIASASVPVA